METNSKKTPEVLFADHETGVCYPYPENGEQNEKPYISYEYLAGIISSRNEYIEEKLKELGTEKGDEKKNEKKLILLSALTELSFIDNAICEKINERLGSDEQS